MDEDCIQVKNLTKSFSSRRVVDNLSFEVKKGEVFALLGHNGAGKSTTIDLILGLKKADEGTARILGMDAVNHRKQVFERVGVQLQNTSYQSLITVEEACIEYASLYEKPADYNHLLDNLRRMYCSPCSPGRLLACDMISSGMIAAVSTVLLTIAAVIFGYRMSGSVIIYIVIWLLTMISMFSIGLMVASLCSTTRSMNIATSLLYFPMLLFSGAAIPAEVFPAGVRAVIKWLPLGIGIESLKKVSLGCYNEILIPTIVMIVITVICTGVAIKTFRWE